ncbi:glycosyltransferase family 2 protein [Romboutsia sp. 1001713B170131_170501_G6]|uniref:glycosyltransferase family 2 protein n=1 Tax=Romboutsia sp. 1001713B170131_170501_G6 TaxID=2787108 RepID=UPI0018A9A366|nr:glycosyltransferase [Romboutsia sp. 1001713B170131_170501_G6]
MNKPLVSVFIAAYNAEKYICECIESVINQTYENLEILIIDDGSTDNTCNKINLYNDTRIRLVKNMVNMGLPYTRNRALDIFKGDYLAILDSDDISAKDRIEKQVKYLEENRNIDIVTSDYTVFNGNISKRIRINKGPENIKASLIFGCTLCNSTSMIRRSSLKKFNLRYNDSCFVAQDYELWSQFSKKGSIFNIPETLLNYRIGHENITKKTKINKINERKKVISSIQKGMLDYYGFKLNAEEETIFYDFFSDNYSFDILKKYNYNQIELLVNKLSSINLEKNIFNQEIFLEELDFASKQRIFNHKISLIDKMKLYNRVIKGNDMFTKFSDVLKIILKHIQNTIKNTN